MSSCPYNGLVNRITIAGLLASLALGACSSGPTAQEEWEACESYSAPVAVIADLLATNIEDISTFLEILTFPDGVELVISSEESAVSFAKPISLSEEAVEDALDLIPDPTSGWEEADEHFRAALSSYSTGLGLLADRLQDTEGLTADTLSVAAAEAVAGLQKGLIEAELAAETIPPEGCGERP